MILIAAGFHGVSKRVQVALGSPPLGKRAGFHAISKRDQLTEAKRSAPQLYAAATAGISMKLRRSCGPSSVRKLSG